MLDIGNFIEMATTSTYHFFLNIVELMPKSIRRKQTYHNILGSQGRETRARVNTVEDLRAPLHGAAYKQTEVLVWLWL